MPTRKTKPGLYANIHAKQERIAHGSDEKVRKPGEQGAPNAKAFDKAEKTATPAKKTASAKSASAKSPAAKSASAAKTAKPKGKAD